MDDFITEMLECAANIAAHHDVSAEEFAEEAIRVYCAAIGVVMDECEIELKVSEKPASN